MTHPTTITATPNLPYVEITREFDAPVPAVFRAHTDPTLYARWQGDTTLDITDFDATPGGRWRYQVNLPDGMSFAFHGIFHTVRPDELIVQTFEFDQAPDQVGLTTISFADLNGRTRLHLRELYPSLEAREMAMASGMESGIIAAYERLDALVAASIPA